ncbi:MAG: hypothetical protein HY456_01000 [Parcubacteria group bacterium]|nr:hypothetical protein [Parcubacteria group bacterium]
MRKCVINSIILLALIVFVHLLQAPSFKSFREAVEIQGIDAAWDFLRATGYSKRTGAKLVFGGEKMYERYGLEEGILRCPPEFFEGCSAGVMKAAVAEGGVAEAQNLFEYCRDIRRRRGLAAGCVHGLGHGLIWANNLSVPEALSDCDAISKIRQEQCHLGVFQEYFRFGPLERSEDNSKHLCDEVSDRHKKICIFTQATVGFGRSKLTVEQELSICGAEQNLQLREICFLGSASSIGRSFRGSPNFVLEKCNVFPADVRDYCVLGAVKQIKHQRFTNWQKGVEALCESVAPQFRQRCLKFGRSGYLDF